MTATATALPGAVAEALGRVERMGATPSGVDAAELRVERFRMLTSSDVPVGAGPFRALVTMLFLADVDAEAGVLVYKNGNDALAAATGTTVRNARKNVDALRRLGFIEALAYGGLRGDNREVTAWTFTSPVEQDGGDLYDLALAWAADRGSTAVRERRRDFVDAMRRLYGEDVIVPDHLPQDIAGDADVLGFVDHLRAVHRQR